jgi:hypothetical protein
MEASTYMELADGDKFIWSGPMPGPASDAMAVLKAELKASDKDSLAETLA